MSSKNTKQEQLPQAPIFQFARFGVTGDYAHIVPALVEALRQHQSEHEDWD